MKKLVVSSFYNALIDSEEAIPFSTMLEIERIRKQGDIFTVCTNNLYTEVLSYNRDFPFLDYIVSLNGSCVYDVKKEKYLLKKKLSTLIVKKIIRDYSDKKIRFFTTTGMFYDVPNEDIYKIELEYSKKIDVEELRNLNVNISVFSYNKQKYFEITSSLVDNFTAIEKIMSHNKISLEETIVVGANEADIPLIKSIPNNYVVKNSPQILKKIATKKTNSNDSKGVEKVLRKI